MGCINMKPLSVVGADISKQAKPQKTADVKAAIATAASFSTATLKMLTVVAASKGDDKSAKLEQQVKKTILAEAVLTLVPAISDLARRTIKEDEVAKVVNIQNRKSFIDSLFVFSVEGTSNADHTKAFILNNDTINIILQYLLLSHLFYDMTASAAQLSTLDFFNADEKDFSKAMVVAERLSLAASFVEIEEQVRANPKILITTCRLNYYLNGMPAPLVIEGTLEQLAIILLDISLQPEDMQNLNRGLANKLRILREELLPDTLLLAAKQAAITAPILDKESDKAIDAEQLPILSQAFDLIKMNNTEAAVKAVKDYIKKIKPEVIENYSYFLKLLRFLGNAFTGLVARDGELNGKWFGIEVEEYCSTIGHVVEMEFGQILRSQLKHLFRWPEHVSRFFHPENGPLVLSCSSFSSAAILRSGRVFAEVLAFQLFQLHRDYICRVESLRCVTESTAPLNRFIDLQNTSTPKLAVP